MKQPGTIVTFYSRTGGVGRTMALANIAVLLARRGLHVLAADFDLRTPTLQQYFAESEPVSAAGGLPAMLRALHVDASIERWREHACEVPVGSLTLIPGQGPDSMNGAEEFDWRAFYAEGSGGNLIEALRETWASEFDVCLIDGGSGLGPAVGVCTVQLPDVLIPVFRSDGESLDGAREVVLRAQDARQALAFDRMPLQVFPLPTQFDPGWDGEDGERQVDLWEGRMAEFYADWLPTTYSARQVLERTRIPYVAGMEEKLPALREQTRDPTGVAFFYEIAADLLASRFHSVERTFDRAVRRLWLELARRYDPVIEQAARTAARAGSARDPEEVINNARLALLTAAGQLNLNASRPEQRHLIRTAIDRSIRATVQAGDPSEYKRVVAAHDSLMRELGRRPSFEEIALRRNGRASDLKAINADTVAATLFRHAAETPPASVVPPAN